MRVGSLFSGYDGIGLALSELFDTTTAWVSDIDPGACKVLAHHWPDVPNLGDITGIDWSTVEPVDVLTGGFPCQDVSLAGRRQGLTPDTRSGLWAHMAHAIAELRPPLVVIENVRGLCSAEAIRDVEPCPWCVGDGGRVNLRALGAVLSDLADLGYDTQWSGLRAADVGAPHGRFRVFIVARDTYSVAGAAHVSRDGRPGEVDGSRAVERTFRSGRLSVAANTCGEQVGEQPVSIAGRGREAIAGLDHAPTSDADGEHERTVSARTRRGEPEASARNGGAPAADPEGDGWDTRRTEPARQQRGLRPTGSGGSSTPDAYSDGREVLKWIEPSVGAWEDAYGCGSPGIDWGQYADAIHRWGRILGRPAPRSHRRRISRRTNPKPRSRRMDDGTPRRSRNRRGWLVPQRQTQGSRQRRRTSTSRRRHPLHAHHPGGGRMRLFTRLYAWWFDHFNRRAIERDERDIRTLQHAYARLHRYDSWENRND